MNVGSLLRALRFDGLWWRKFAYLGSVYSPEWWKRYSPPWIAAIIYLCVGRNRRGALANIRRIIGRRGWVRDHLAAFDVFPEKPLVNGQPPSEFEDVLVRLAGEPARPKRHWVIE